MTFPNILIATDFACGGIIVTILNNTQIAWDPRLQGSINSAEHNKLKYLENFEKNIKECKSGVWYQTHDDNIPLEYFDKKLVVTTEDIRSRYIIFLRCHKFLNPDNWVENDALDLIDENRELAKKYSIPRITKTRPGCENIELIDLLNDNHSLFDTDNKQWKTWKKANSYLYESHEWLQKRFDEAVWEIENQQPYQYL